MIAKYSHVADPFSLHYPWHNMHGVLQCTAIWPAVYGSKMLDRANVGRCNILDVSAELTRITGTLDVIAIMIHAGEGGKEYTAVVSANRKVRALELSQTDLSLSKSKDPRSDPPLLQLVLVPANLAWQS